MAKENMKLASTQSKNITRGDSSIYKNETAQCLEENHSKTWEDNDIYSQPKLRDQKHFMKLKMSLIKRRN